MLTICSKLTALQSRLLATSIALALIVITFWTLATPRLVYAAELRHDGRGHSRDAVESDWYARAESELLADGVEDDSKLIDYGVRDGPIQIAGNDIPVKQTIGPGTTQQFIYPNTLRLQQPNMKGRGLPWDEHMEKTSFKSQLELKARNTSGTLLYISINTCEQPIWNGTTKQEKGPPQLTLYLANRTADQVPGPKGSNVSQTSVKLGEGFASFSVAVTDALYLAVTAPKLSKNYTGQYSFELAVSLTDYYHAVESEQMLFLVDTDDNSALFVTKNLTQANANSENYAKWMNMSTPFVMYASHESQTRYLGIQNSSCGWEWAKQFAADQADLEGARSHVQMGMVTRGLGNKPKQQFYATQLETSGSYIGVMAMRGNSTSTGNGVVGGGGKVWPLIRWSTKADGNCAMLFNLTFCSEVAYAVPSNPSKFNITGMRTLLDNYTSTFYQNFNYSLQQIPCNTTSDARYSLTKNCDDCAAAYKDWLCAVSIPRCEDFTNLAPYLQPRNVGQPFFNGSSLPTEFLTQQYIPMNKAPTLPGSPRDQGTYLSSLATNSSRNPLIDQQIMPGPYREVLPCEDLCYNLVQSCPASLGFGCPLPGRGLEASYGKRDPSGTLTCSYLGAVHKTNSAPARSLPGALLFTIAVMVTGCVM